MFRIIRNRVKRIFNLLRMRKKSCIKIKTRKNKLKAFKKRVKYTIVLKNE